MNKQLSLHSILVRHDDGALSHHAPQQLQDHITDFDDIIGLPLYVLSTVQNAPAVNQALTAVPLTAKVAALVTAPRHLARTHKPVQRMGL